MALEPITRKEKIIAGENLEPITRMEQFLKKFGGSGGGSGVQPDWNQNDDTQPDFVKNRPCYRDYLGTETVTNTVRIGAGTFVEDKGAAYADVPIEDSAFTGFILGETYTVTIDGVTADYVARNLPRISEDFGPIIGTTTTYEPESGGDPYDGWYAAAYQFEGSTVCNVVTLDVSFIGKTISISKTKTETVDRYKTKLLPEYLLPEFLRSGSVIEVVQTSDTTGGSAIILRSSTADSTKRFRITVDDTGTLTAMEVT